MLLGGQGAEEDLKPSSSEESVYRAIKEEHGSASNESLAKGRFKTPPPRGGTPPVKSKFAARATAKANPRYDGVAQGLVKTAQSGARPVPLAKPPPKAAAVPDPMLATMQTLAQSLGNLNNQMQDMSKALKDLQAESKTKPKAGLKAPPPPAPYELPPSGLTGPFYAVAYGLNGHQGIYATWSKCATWVTGVPGNVFQKCSSLEEANGFIHQYNASQQARKKEAQGGNLFREGPGGITGNLVVNSSGPYAQGELAFERLVGKHEGEREVNPPLAFFGPDPPIKKEEEFYGFNLSTEWDINKILLPKGFDSSIGKGVVQAVADVVSLPGGYQSNVGNDEEGLALFTQSMAEMAHGNKADSEIFGRPDFTWRPSGRTSLKSVTSAAKLTKRFKRCW
jgi:hypothetical protein